MSDKRAIREIAIEAAIQGLQDGTFSSQTEAAKAYAIPRSTLVSRLQGVQSHQTAHLHQQRLTSAQEAFLAEWILEEDSYGRPPSHTRAREMAARLLKMNGDTQPLGQGWLRSFQERNPSVASILGRKIDASRANAATPQQIQAFLDLFEETRKRLNIQHEDIWNMDETGLALGVCENSQVFASSKKKKTYVKTPENREWVSVVETISATGKKLRCLVIFKGKSLQSSWFSIDQVPDWIYTFSENGWTSNQTGLNWVQQIFIPETQPRDPRRLRLLILDGHGSHASVSFHLACKNNGIHLLYLPAHTSHILQPLDLSPFSILKKSYRRQITALSALDDAANVKKKRFIQCYHQAREEGLSERYIRAGWKASGMVPFNPIKVLSSSQVSQPQQPPSTPKGKKRAYPDSSPSFQTPQKPQDIYSSSQTIQRSSTLPRKARVLFHKAGKALGEANTRAARLEGENTSLRAVLQDLQDKTKVKSRVQVDLNTRFAQVDAIKKALDEAAEATAKRATIDPEKEAQKAAKAAVDASFQSLLFEWQI